MPSIHSQNLNHPHDCPLCHRYHKGSCSKMSNGSYRDPDGPHEGIINDPNTNWDRDLPHLQPKTVPLCRFDGYCRHGDQCQFRHNTQFQRIQNDFPNGTRKRQRPRSRRNPNPNHLHQPHQPRGGSASRDYSPNGRIPKRHRSNSHNRSNGGSVTNGNAPGIPPGMMQSGHCHPNSNSDGTPRRGSGGRMSSTETVGILINTRYGGFALSDLAETEYMKRKNCSDGDKDKIEWPEDGKKYLRDDPDLLDVYGQIGSQKMSDGISRISLERIPRDAHRFNAWDIDEYDGLEKIRINQEKIELEKMKQDVSTVLTSIARILHGERGRVKKQERLDSLRRVIPVTLAVDQLNDPRTAIDEMLQVMNSPKASKTCVTNE